MPKIISNMIEAHICKISFMNPARIQYLLLKRSDKEIYPNLWQMVTGHIKNNEKAYQTALREIKEETNLTPTKMWVVPQVNSFYSDKEDSICLIPVFLALVNENSNVIISKEHTEFKWVEKDEAIELLAWPGQKESVSIIENYLTKQKSYLEFVKIDI